METSFIPKPEKPKVKAGPKPDTIKIHRNCQAAMRGSLKKKKPPVG